MTRSLTVPDSELEYRYSRSGGPGGQHANKTSTKVELVWNVAGSNALGPRQRARLLESLGRRLDSSGTLRLASDRYRSQHRNKEDVNERLRRLVAQALATRRSRVATAPTAASKQRRLDQKRRRSDVKKMRRTPPGD
ncbi:MAG TPA: alternative ribosome rescue aminoacyl-tRNA hydrolase ArfB [Actinomycetota bacterium]|nr:alternative ribosome rescue aminoacyl-tRNA hydrolase ArfB [Actinomycetota bacterium]